MFGRGNTHVTPPPGAPRACVACLSSRGGGAARATVTVPPATCPTRAGGGIETFDRPTRSSPASIPRTELPRSLSICRDSRTQPAKLNKYTDVWPNNGNVYEQVYIWLLVRRITKSNYVSNICLMFPICFCGYRWATMCHLHHP